MVTRVHGGVLAAVAVCCLTGATVQSGEAWPLRLGRPRTTVVGIGDSVTSGAHCGCATFIRRYADQVARQHHESVRSIDLGQPGATSAGLLAAIQPGGRDVVPLADATVVVLTIGANDFANHPARLEDDQCGGSDGLACTIPVLARVTDNVAAIIARIRRLHRGHPVTIKVTGYWNIFEDGAVARADYPDWFRRAADVLTRRLNAVLRRIAQHRGAEYVDLYTPFKGPNGTDDDTDLLEPDGDHPNSAGHALIARTLTQH